MLLQRGSQHKFRLQKPKPQYPATGLLQPFISLPTKLNGSKFLHDFFVTKQFSITHTFVARIFV